jgi:hypothetical protein
MEDNEGVRVQVLFFSDVSLREAARILEKNNLQIEFGPGMLNDWRGSSSMDAILTLAEEDSVRWIELVPPPETTLDDDS